MGDDGMVVWVSGVVCFPWGSVYDVEYVRSHPPGGCPGSVTVYEECDSAGIREIIWSVQCAVDVWSQFSHVRWL